MFSRTRKKEKKQPAGPERDVNQSSALILPEDLQVIKDLGEGHYGIVQLGLWNPKDGRPESNVAIKSLKNTAVDGVLKCVLEEARTMQKLSHKFIVKMYGISLPFKEEPLKLVTEYAFYGSLEDNLKKNDRDVCRVSALSIFSHQVAQGMDYLAKQNLVHRDLSTRNILVFQPDLVKISDFGLARTLDEGAATQITVHRKLAVAWLPPEAIVDNVFTRWSDVWSYGITLWEMFSFGQQPWAQLSLNQIKIMIANEPRNHLKKPDACPDGFYEIMLDCWEPDQEERPTFDDISNKVSELQPREGITKVCHRTSVAGHLSYDSKRKVTVISKREEGLLLVQSEYGSIGLVHEKNLDFSKRALQKRVSGRNAGDITRPHEPKKQKSTDLFTKLHKATNKAVVEEDAVVRKPQTQTEENDMARDLIDWRDDANSDPTNPLSPMRYTGNLGTNHERMPQVAKENQALEPEPQGATVDHVIAQSRPGSSSGYISMDYHLRNRAANEDDYVTFKEVKGPQDMMARTQRTLSESHALGPASDGDSGVLYQHRQGPKHDTLLKRGPQDIPGANTLDRNCRPDIPDRPDLQEHTGITSGAVGSVLSTSAPSYSPLATTPRKTSRRPVPTPRRNTNARPASDGSLDRKTVRNGKEVLPENGDFQALNNSETAKSSDTGGVVGASADKNEPPPIPLPYQPTRTSLERQELNENTSVRSELRLEGQKGDNKELQVELQDQTLNYDTASEQPMKKKHYIIIGQPIPNGEGTAQASASQDSCGQDVLNESQAPAADQITGATSSSDSFQPTEDRHFVNADEVKRLSADFADLSLNPEEEPIYDKPIQLPDPPYISKEILNQPPPSPSKLFGGTFREDLDTSFQPPPGGWDDNSAFHPFYQPPLPGYSPKEPVNPVDQSDQYVNPGGATSEGAYGEEIDAGIQEIREIFGEEVPRDWCYAALLQFQGDVNQVVRVIKVQKLSKLTGKTELFCERTLSHCTWNLDRAASYIFENFEDKDV